MGSVTDFKLKQLSKAWLKFVIFVAFEGTVSSNKLTHPKNAWLNKVIAELEVGITILTKAEQLWKVIAHDVQDTVAGNFTYCKLPNTPNELPFCPYE